jgi:hypothetical protein
MAWLVSWLVIITEYIIIIVGGRQLTPLGRLLNVTVIADLTIAVVIAIQSLR